MKYTRAVIATVGIAFVIAIGAMAARATLAAGPAPVNLGTAANFSVLAGTPSITNTGPTTIDLQVGIHPAASVTGFPPGVAPAGIHRGDAAALNAKADLVTAYNVAANAPVTANYTALGGLSLVGGVYGSGGATLDLTGVLTLDGQNDPSSVWIFQASSDLVTASGSFVNYVNGASPCNVFWQVTSSATLGTGSRFVGTIMALTSVTLGDSVTVYGRALARNGTVTLINDRFLTTACQSAPLAVQATLPPFTLAPSATPTGASTTAPTTTPATVPTATPAGASTTAPTTTPATVPTATPAGTAAPTGAVSAAPTATPIVAAVQTAAPSVAAVAGAPTLPSTSTDPLGPLVMLGMALTGIGVLLLVRRPIQHL